MKKTRNRHFSEKKADVLRDFEIIRQAGGRSTPWEKKADFPKKFAENPFSGFANPPFPAYIIGNTGPLKRWIVRSADPTFPPFCRFQYRIQYQRKERKNALD